MGVDSSGEVEFGGGEWTASASARAGLAGNPSDALGGAALAVSVPALRARVRLRAAPRMSVRGPANEASWESIEALAAQVSRFGHEGADRLVTAAIVTLWRHLRALGAPIADPSPFEVEWASDIPRSVGLAGSSALVVATIRAAAQRWGVELDPATVASLALSAERDELGIAAGWMDRAVQAHDAAVLVEGGEMRVVATSESCRVAGGLGPRWRGAVGSSARLARRSARGR